MALAWRLMHDWSINWESGKMHWTFVAPKGACPSAE